MHTYCQNCGRDLKPMPVNGLCFYCTKIENEARKQGKEEERRRIEKAYDEARCDHMAQDAFQIAIKAGGAAEPVCTCTGDAIARMGHSSFCPCHKPPEPEPLEKVLPHTFDPDNFWDVVDVVNTLSRRVNRIDARGRP